MGWSRCRFAVFVALVGCSDAVLQPAATSSSLGDSGQNEPTLAVDAGKDGSAVLPRGAANLRIMAGNISSGPSSTYDPDPTLHLIQGLHPDVALLQELKYGDGSEAALRTLVTTGFGPDFVFFRESGLGIPNGIVTRYPILESGQWDDPEVNDRGFAYAKIAVPGAHPLWAVSVHLLTTGSANRNSEATALLGHLKEVVAPDDYVVIGGDLNTDTRGETCLTTLGELVATGAPYPVDQNGRGNTNANRNKPYDWVLVDPKLASTQVPTVLGASTYPIGLVFDSRVYTPLSEVAPIVKTDSASTNMQHMPVVKDFALEP